MNDWSDLFPDDDFGFRLTLRRGDPGEFFKPTTDAKEIVSERKKPWQKLLEITQSSRRKGRTPGLNLCGRPATGREAKFRPTQSWLELNSNPMSCYFAGTPPEPFVSPEG
jgi:hypothetical protein